MPTHQKASRKHGTKKGHQRIAGRKRKGTTGNAANFVTRQQAIKKLQITLPEFRKLCILHGIYPREPRKAFKGKNKTYFYTKDVQHLAHDPLLKQYRDYLSWRKKVTKAKHKKETRRFESLLENKPKYRLDHVVLRRYPTFDDALEDLDDALCMLYLFASVGQNDRIDPKRIQNCVRLSKEWESIVAYTSSLRKVFVSIKGIYYQAEISGNSITWLVPHQFSYPIPKDVDIRVMLTFLEFYESLMSFVIFKLYHDLEIPYPQAHLPLGNVYPCPLAFSKSSASITDSSTPFTPSSSSSSSASTSTSTRASTSVAKKLSAILPQILDEEAKNEEATETNDVVIDDEPEDESEPQHPLSKLFLNCKILLSRETPIPSLEFCIKSCGGSVSWISDEGYVAPFDESEATHQVVDRPLLNQMVLNRNYVQPQWVFDCVNTGILLPVEEYVPGHELPPHLSPFVNDQQEGYVPDQRKKLDALIARAKNEVQAIEESEEAVQTAAIDVEKKYQEELEKETKGISYSEAAAEEEDAGAVVVENEKEKEKEVGEDELASIMIPSKKKRRLFQRIQYSERAKKRKVEVLEKKRDALSSKE